MRSFFRYIQYCALLPLLAAILVNATGCALGNGSDTPAGFHIQSTSLRDGVSNLSYSMLLTATGGTTPYTWALQSGSLPAGLTLDSSGFISGTPSSSGSTNVVIQVTDATSKTATQTFSFNVRAATTADGTPGQFSGLLTDSTDYSSAFSTPTLPNEGATLTESTWNTTIRRIQYPPDGNCPSSQNPDSTCTGTFGGINASIVPDYSKKLAINLDGTKLLLLQGRGAWYQLYDARTYQWQSRISDFAESPNEVTWSKTSPDILFYKAGMHLRSYNISTHADTLVHDFSSICSTCSVILDGDEGNQSEDDRLWAFYTLDSTGTNDVDALVYDMQADTVVTQTSLTTLCGGTCAEPVGTQNINWIGMSPAGDYVVVNWNLDHSLQTKYVRGTGTEAFKEADLSFYGELSPSNSHADVGYDVNGKEVYVGLWGETGLDVDAWTLRICELGTLTQTTVLLPESFAENPSNITQKWGKYYHISMRATRGAAKGWMLMSIYQPNGDATLGNGWGADEMVAIKIDTAVATNNIWRRLGRHYSIRDNDYFAEPHAVPTLTFDKVIFGSNWTSVGGPDYPFVMELP